MPDQSSAATEHAILQEITRPLDALPDDPLSVVNAEFPVALRGYDRETVDGYVRRTRQLVAELQATRSPESAVRRALERVGEQISGILQRAHETAEQITAQSRSEAEDRLEQARDEAAHIAGAAERRVRDLDADTDRIWLERQRIVADAEDLAGQLLALAKTAAERFPADAAPEHEPAGLGDPAGDVPVEPAPSFAAEDYEEAEAVEAAEAVEVAEAVEAGVGKGDDRDSEGGGAEGGLRGTDREMADDVEQTVAFQPLEPTPSDTEPPADGRPTSEDTTAVIPPASQAAAHRRPLP